MNSNNSSDKRMKSMVALGVVASLLLSAQVGFTAPPPRVIVHPARPVVVRPTPVRRPHVTVRAPIPFGRVVVSLPAGYVSFTVGGILFYTVAGNYYKKAPQGFVVVSNPLPEASPESKVSVTSEALNVRSAPGIQNSIVTVVKRGMVLDVLGTSDSWLYIKTPDEKQGWVARRYTVVFNKPADG